MVEAHEPYHGLPVSKRNRVAQELWAEERRTGRANYAAVPPARACVIPDACDDRAEPTPANIGTPAPPIAGLDTKTSH